MATAQKSNGATNASLTKTQKYFIENPKAMEMQTMKALAEKMHGLNAEEKLVVFRDITDKRRSLISETPPVIAEATSNAFVGTRNELVVLTGVAVDIGAVTDMDIKVNQVRETIWSKDFDFAAQLLGEMKIPNDLVAKMIDSLSIEEAAALFNRLHDRDIELTLEIAGALHATMPIEKLAKILEETGNPTKLAYVMSAYMIG